MQTGCDSYWMYQNNRPGSLYNLPNKNHYSNAVFPDSNKHVQNGRLLNHCNDCMQPPNNVAYYYQNGQYSTSDCHQMPPSMYSEPFRPSNINNTQPRGTSVNWSNRSGHLPHNSYTHENFNVRPSENHTEFSQVNISTDKNNVRVNPAPDNSSISKISRIRVKDVYSINNNNVNDVFLNRPLQQSYTIRQKESVINYKSNNYSAINHDPQNEFIDNTYLAQPKLPPPYYRCTTAEQPQQSYSQFGNGRSKRDVSINNTSDIVSQKIHPDKNSSGNLLQRTYSNEKASGNYNSGQMGSVQMHDQITQTQSCHQNELGGNNYSETLSSSNMSTYKTHGISKSSHLAIPNLHEKVSQNGDVNLAGFNLSKTPRTNLNSQVTSKPVNYPREEGTVIKISIPHTGQSCFIRLNDCNSATNNSNLSLPCLLDSNNEYVNAVTQDCLSNNINNINENLNLSVPPTTTNVNTHDRTPTSVESHQNLNNSSMSQQVVNPMQSFINAINERMNNLVSKSVPQEDLASKTRNDTNNSKLPISEENIKLNSLTAKQEKSVTTPENLRKDDHSISGNNELDKIITKEKIPVEETHEDNSVQFSENLSTLEKSSPVLEKTGSSDSIEVRILAEKLKDIPSEQPESLGNSVSKGQGLEEGDPERHSYTSKINRVKLDKLIQFLKDDETHEGDFETRGILKQRNRKKRIQKINKTCIGRNKNISEEMVSQVSQKTSRVDPSIPSPEISNTVKFNMDSEKGKEEKENYAKTDEKIKKESFTSSEHLLQKEDSSQLERNIKNELISEVQEPALKCFTGENDKEMINMMRILRTMTTNFCTNCKLSSSADSFWVNVVSFELRCLNCFKKILPREFTTKNCVHDTVKQEVNSGDESNLKDVDNLNCFSKCLNSNSEKIQQEKSNNLKEQNLAAKLPEDSSKRRRESFERSNRKESLKEEDITDGRQNSKENVAFGKTKNCIGEKYESSDSEESKGKISSKKNTLKDQHVDNRSRISENECKNEKLFRSSWKRVEDVLEKETKGFIDTLKRKSSTESTPNKASVPEENAQKERKRLMNSKEKERSMEEPKISKYTKPEMSEIVEIPPKSKEIHSSGESKSNSSDLENKKSLKRKHSNDDPSLCIVYISDDHCSERISVVTRSSDKTNSTKDIIPQKIKSEDHEIYDAIKTPPRKRTPRNAIQQNEDKNLENEYQNIPKFSSSDKDNEKQLEKLKIIKIEEET